MNDSKPLFVLGSFVAACCAKVARLPRPGESLLADGFTLEAGGKGLNLAVGIRRLGAEVGGVLAVGEDLFGGLAEPALARAGLASVLVRRHPAPTGSGIAFIDAQGENCLAVYPGANLLLSAQDVRASADALRQAGLVLAQFEIGDEPILEAFASAHATGATTLLNPSPFRACDPNILALASILVVNRVEAAQLAASLGLGAEGLGAQGLGAQGLGAQGLGAQGLGVPGLGAEGDAAAAQWRGVPLEAASRLSAALLDRGPATVIVTLGPDGALACRRGMAPWHQPAFAVEAIDTVGAGDAFAAGLAVAWNEGRSPQDCVRHAAACGALVAQRPGVFDALPTRQELDAFLARAA